MTNATTQDPRAWRVAIAMALALPEPLDWARWASGETNLPKPRTVAPWTTMPCDACGCDHLATRGGPRHAHVYLCVACEAADAPGWVPTPVPAPWDAAAYLADCARRGVEPGPLPSLEWTGPDGRVWWKIVGPSLLRIGVRTVEVRLWTDNDPGWVMVDSDEDDRIETADVVEIGRLMQAVDGATAAAKAMVP